jgi:hypothetical protein
MRINLHPTPPKYPFALTARDIVETTFLKTMIKGDLNVHVYYDPSHMYLITVDQHHNEVNFEKRERQLRFYSDEPCH